MRIARLLAVALLATAPAAAEEINRVVLRVNDEIVTLREYEQRRADRLQAIAAASDLSVEDRRRLAADAGRSTMRELFEELLVFSRAQQLRIEATPAKVDRAIDQARRRFGIESDEEFALALAQSGGTLAEFRDRIARNLLFSEVVQKEVSPRVKVEDEEVARYWREHPDEFGVPERRLVHEAVVRDDSGLDAAARGDLARRIRDALIGGDSVTAAVEAADAGDHVLVLDHGWIERGTLEASLEAAVWELGAGGVAGPLPGRGGLHVLHLLEVKPPTQRPLDEVRPRILARLQEERFDRESRNYVEELARTAYVVERLPDDAVGYREAVRGPRDPVRELLRGSESEPAAATDESSNAAAADAPPAPAA